MTGPTARCRFSLFQLQQMGYELSHDRPVSNGHYNKTKQLPIETQTHEHRDTTYFCCESHKLNGRCTFNPLAVALFLDPTSA